MPYDNYLGRLQTMQEQPATKKLGRFKNNLLNFPKFRKQRKMGDYMREQMFDPNFNRYSNYG